MEGKDLGIAIQKPGEDKVSDNMVIKGMTGLGDRGGSPGSMKGSIVFRHKG